MYLLQRKQCKNPKCKGNKNGFVKLVNEEYCMKCYQAFYYKNKTKRKRRKNKTATSLLSVWWLE